LFGGEKTFLFGGKKNSPFKIGGREKNIIRNGRALLFQRGKGPLEEENSYNQM